MSSPYTPKPGSLTEQVVNAILKAGTIRSPQLAEVAKVPQKNLHGLLRTPIQHGLVTACDVEIGEEKIKEYRPGPGVPPISARGDLKPGVPPISARGDLKPGKSGPIPVRDSANTVGAGRKELPGQEQRAPQPAVGQNTGSAEPETPPFKAGDRAVAAAAPESETERRGMGPAPEPAPVRQPAMAQSQDRTCSFAISDDGVLGITQRDGDQIRLTPADVAALHHFTEKTDAIWRAS